MTSKKKSQRQRFIEKARELECEEDPKVFDRLFSRILPPKKAKPTKKGKTTNARRS